MNTANCGNCGLCSVNATIVSTHNTSEGIVRYLRCPCDATQYIEILSFVTWPGPPTKVASAGVR